MSAPSPRATSPSGPELGASVPVLMVVGSLRVGGAERLLADVATRLDRRRFAASVVSLSDDNPLGVVLEAQGIPLVPLPRRWRFDLSPARRIREMTKEGRAAAILCLGVFERVFVRIALVGIRERPFILVAVHATEPEGLANRVRLWLFARFVARSDRLIAVCRAQARYWEKHNAIPTGRFGVIYNGVDTAYFDPAAVPSLRSQTRRQLDIPEDAFLVLQVAGFRRCKRHGDSILAMRWLMERDDDRRVYLAFVGGGSPSAEETLREQAAQLRVEDRVRFCGLQEDVRPYYAAADAFTLTSDSVETFSVAALEAMSMGLPAVLTDVGGLAEMIAEGENGFIVPRRNPAAIGEAWLRLMREGVILNPAAIRELVIRRFGIDACVRHYEAELLAGAEDALRPPRNARALT